MTNCEWKQVKEVEPVQCYALTMGHVIDIDQRMETLNEPGRYLLYRHTRKEFQVTTTLKTAICVPLKTAHRQSRRCISARGGSLGF